MNNLRRSLCSFRIQEETPVECIFNDHSMESVFQEIKLILENAEPMEVSHVLCFIRDANLFKHTFRDAFQTYLATADIWDEFRKLLVVPNFAVRRGTIYTIGKLTNRNRSGLLAEAFPFYLERDPLNLPSLQLEHLWLTNKWNWDFIQQVATAQHYLKRWSICQLLDEVGNSPETSEAFLAILTKLINDTNPHVAAEANLRFERIKIKLEPKLAKPEWRKEVRRIALLQPRVTFESAAMSFMQNRDDYNLDEFDRYVSENFKAIA